MAYFLNNELIITRSDSEAGIKFSLYRSIIFYLNDYRNVVVPQGSQSNLASIPKLLWWWFPPTGRYDKAAFVHDYLYQGGVVTIEATGEKYRPSRGEADYIFLTALKALGISFRRRHTMYLAVRAFGHKFYRK